MTNLFHLPKGNLKAGDASEHQLPGCVSSVPSAAGAIVLLMIGSEGRWPAGSVKSVGEK